MKIVQLYIQVLCARGSLGLMALVQYFRRICIILASDGEYFLPPNLNREHSVKSIVTALEIELGWLLEGLRNI